MTVSSPNSNSLYLKHLEHSKTFAYMVTLIQDEIDDTTAEYSVQIQDSILTALRFCEREPFFFNEKRKLTFKTQSGKTWYGKEDGFFLELEKALESVSLGEHGAMQKQLIPKSLEVLKKQYGEQPLQGTPLFYSYFEKKIGLFPTPKDVEIICVSYDPMHLGDVTVMEEDNPWLLHAFDLVKARAKYELYKNILKDPEYAAVSFNDFQEQLKALQFETSRRKDFSNIVPMGF
ncbi:hypothetical protein [Bartonella doshiae]|uniref:Uncharacterized protein n=2 Tax=Bartonella doshiae TaxID=33044 RepID=A0A380ZG26_BARDO|nr:hypothetical protein [Bartonella doshiae]EJF79945.1 hypothetical protein MCS_01286 [Bartonella doshiae NCTC 12862 = ATCC 700133]MBB6158951.1 hypothetical protein [Bartonella doshiae]SUV45510.1 Uncharacterised protein [Bartonella doshiae]